MTLFVLGPNSRAKAGTTIGLGCQGCGFLEPCGGTTDFDCYPNCCGEPNRCRSACPRSDNFSLVVQDGGGISIERNYCIRHSEDDLPLYIPHVHSGSCRSQVLESPYVALTTFDLIAPKAKRLFGTAAELREHFRVTASAKILLVSIAKDDRLEHFWRFAASRNLAVQLANLGVSHITAPNFSFPLDVPRPEHLVNRSRSLLAAEMFAAAGLSVIPHVNAFNRTDYDCWRDFLRDHPHLSMIAQEFQTGLATRKKASWHIWQLRNVEQSLGRRLRLIAVAGRRHLPLLVGLSAVTITDSVPFMRTHMRRRLDHNRGGWEIRQTPKGEPLDELLQHNVAMYTRQVEVTIASCKRVGPVVPCYEDVPAEETAIPLGASDSQLRLPLFRAANMKSSATGTAALGTKPMPETMEQLITQND